MWQNSLNGSNKLTNHPLLQKGEGKKKRIMYVDIFELTPSAQAPRNDCYSCLGYPYLQDITLNSSHEVYIECDLGEEEDKQ